MFGSMVSAGMQYIIPHNKDYYVTRVVDAVMDLKYDKLGTNYEKLESFPSFTTILAVFLWVIYFNFLGISDYLYFDPKFPPNSAPRKNTPFREAIVFMVGGGNYLEFQNLKDYAEKVRRNAYFRKNNLF